MDSPLYAIGGIGILTIIALLVKGVKETGKVPSHWLPAVSMSIGTIIGLAWAYATGNGYIQGAFAGIVMGATTSGVYDALKTSTTSTADKIISSVTDAIGSLISGLSSQSTTSETSETTTTNTTT